MSVPRPLDLLRRVWSAEVDLPTTQAAVLTVLLIHRNNKTGLCFPSVTTIAKETHQKRRAVLYQLRQLDDLGVIEVERWRGISNRYHLDLSKLPTSAPDALVHEMHQCTKDTGLVHQMHGTSALDAPELRSNCEGTAKRGEAPSAPAPKPRNGLVEIPVRQSPKGKPTPSTWWLTATTRDKIEAGYPDVDVVPVAEDMARKIRAGARDPYTYRGASRGLASWVAAEAKRGGNRPKPAKQAARVPGRDWNAEAEARRARMIADEEARLAAEGVPVEN